MASFPYRMGLESQETPRAGTEVDFDGNNTPHVRDVAPEKLDFKCILPRVSQAQLAIIDSFYTTNRLLPFDLLWHGDVTYSVKFGRGQPRRKFLGLRVGWRVEFDCHQV